MRILWVKAGGLVPLDSGGRLRSYHILKELTRRHNVTLFTFYVAQPDDPHPALKDLFFRVECLPLKVATGRGLGEGLLYVRNLFSFRPHSIAKFCQPSIIQRVRQLLEEQTYDVIVCDFVFAGGAIPWDFRCPKVLFTHNVESAIWRRHYQVARNPLWKAICWREYGATTRAEKFYLRKADHVLAVSDADRNFFAKIIKPEKITVIPTGVDLDFFRPAWGHERPGALAFTGSMDWLPNQDAMFYFARQVFPLIRREIPSARLTIVGRKPSGRLRALSGSEAGIAVTGGVADVRPYVEEASVYVVPLRIGGGTRLKIFEAMAMGKAIVSTSVGAEGLPITHGENILLADEPQQFANSVVRLLRTPREIGRLGEAARKLVEQDYGWAAVAAQFEQALFKVAAAHSASLS
ncbi:MAG: glycosyltransferase [Terriglobia bacterium]